MFDPFWFLQAPFSGDVKQRINSPWFSPAFTFNFAGDARVEDQVVSNVASYGKQLGWLNEIVLALANKEDPRPETVAELSQAMRKIEVIKAAEKSEVLRTTIASLDRLQAVQPELYKKLLHERSTSADG
jgi:hypothetical protein